MLKFQSYDYILSFFYIIICYCITIPTIEAQTSTSVLSELEAIQVGKLPQDSIIHYVYNIKIIKENNSLIVRDLASSAENFFITITTCKAPLPNLMMDSKLPPANQLEVWISTKIKNPGPGDGGDKYVLNDGYLNVMVQRENDDGIYVGVHAPKLSVNNYSNDSFYYQIGASTKGFMHQAPEEKGLMLDDTDNVNALFRTSYTNIENLSYSTYFTNYTLVNGISMSLCAYQDNNLDLNSVSYKRRENNGKNYQSLILISNLNNGAKYSTLVVEGSDNDGYKLFKPVNFQTQSQSNCAIITNLEFCDKVSYSVPKTNEIDLVGGYDRLAKSYFNNFTSTIDQYPCENAKYSLVRDCNDCKEAYKDWICAITIPRCANLGLNEVSIGNPRTKSRVRVLEPTMEINQPFVELPPCVDLCYNVTRSCPVFIKFGCPKLKSINSTYGDSIAPDGVFGQSCNSLGMNFSISNVAVGIWTVAQWAFIIPILVFTILIVGL